MPGMLSILLVKTSSMGDVIHNLPVVSDIRKQAADAAIDWLVEETFAPVPALHTSVHSVIPISFRRWRSAPLTPAHWRQWRLVAARLNAQRYDMIIDTQGLIKSAWFARRARGTRYGYDWHSAREPLATLFYDHRVAVPKNLHAVTRNRLLAARVLGYEIDAGKADYGIHTPDVAPRWLPSEPFAVLLHASSRADKQWQEAHWIALGREFARKALVCVLPGGSEAERARSAHLAAAIPAAIAAPAMTLTEAAALIGRAKIVVGVDTGLTHLACALGVPSIALYAASDPGLTGLFGSATALNLGKRGEPPKVADVFAAVDQLGC
jgi:heptosyltransferase I